MSTGAMEIAVIDGALFHLLAATDDDDKQWNFPVQLLTTYGTTVDASITIGDVTQQITPGQQTVNGTGATVSLSLKASNSSTSSDLAPLVKILSNPWNQNLAVEDYPIRHQMLRRAFVIQILENDGEALTNIDFNLDPGTISPLNVGLSIDGKPVETYLRPGPYTLAVTATTIEVYIDWNGNGEMSLAYEINSGVDA